MYDRIESMSKTLEIDEPRNLPGFDTLAWSKFLKESGVSAKQAEAQVTVIAHAIGQNAATKADLDNTELALRSDMVSMESSIRADMKNMESSIRADMKNMESRIETKMQALKVDMLRWMFGMFMAQTVLLITVMKMMIG